MSQTAEEIVIARMQEQAPPPPKFHLEYTAILNKSIPDALKGLEARSYEDGEIGMVRIAGEIGSRQLVVWKLTTLMYLTSRGRIAIKVLDPIRELGYGYAEVDLDYLLLNHSSKRTVNFLVEELTKLARSK